MARAGDIPTIGALQRSGWSRNARLHPNEWSQACLRHHQVGCGVCVRLHLRL